MNKFRREQKTSFEFVEMVNQCMQCFESSTPLEAETKSVIEDWESVQSQLHEHNKRFEEKQEGYLQELNMTKKALKEEYEEQKKMHAKMEGLKR